MDTGVGLDSLREIDSVASDALGALHRERIDDVAIVREVLGRLIASGVKLEAGVGPGGAARSVRLCGMDEGALVVEVLTGRIESGRQAFFSGELAGSRFFFASVPEGAGSGALVKLGVPGSIYRSERRGEPRSSGETGDWIVVRLPGPETLSARILDRSPNGLSIGVPVNEARRLPDAFEVEGNREGRCFAKVRDKNVLRGSEVRVGLSLSRTAWKRELPVEYRRSVLPEHHSAWSEIRRGGRAREEDRLRVGTLLRYREKIRFFNDAGRPVVGTVDRTCAAAAGSRGPVVVVPPPWGSTKEAAASLTLILLRTFREAGQPLSVLRYDGSNRRGESYVDPILSEPDSKELGFTFSGAASDLRGALRCARSISAGPVVLITLSLSAIEARHVLASGDEDVAGWISLLGVIDLRSTLRCVSGGIDYAEGFRRGIRFGRHELLGVTVDIDRTGLDAVKERIAFEEDARREMAQVSIPVVWIHGRHDHWIDLRRVREILSVGENRSRRIIDIPTGHRLGDGRSALAAYVLVAEAIATIATGQRILGRGASLGLARAYREAEFERKAELATSMTRFWRRYLIGQGAVGGMELLCGTARYRNFMIEQIEALNVSDNAQIVDLGAGLGEFGRLLFAENRRRGATVVEVDFVKEALQKRRTNRPEPTQSNKFSGVMFDLDQTADAVLPFASASFDFAIASLVISYLRAPEKLLAEARRVLAPGGRLVVSTLHRDADVSSLYGESVMRYATDEARGEVLADATGRFPEAIRDLLNSGMVLMRLEETGRFRFWDELELLELLTSTGFAVERSFLSLGEPPQALVVSATSA